MTAPTPLAGTVGGTNYKYLLGTGHYSLTSLNLQGQEKAGVFGNATLRVSRDINMAGNAYIYIAEGAQLKLYAGGTNSVMTTVTTLGGPTSFEYFGLPANTNFAWGGVGTNLVGTIYAPSAVVTIGGDETTTYDFQGACVAARINLIGHGRLHFDEALEQNGPKR